MKKIWIPSLILSGLVLTSACGKTSSVTSAAEDTSASGAAASALGGALSSSNSGGSVAMFQKKGMLNQCTDVLASLLPSALAANSCPTFRTAGAGCTASTTNLWLSYSACSFGASAAVWNGTQLIQMSSGTAVCGTFPNPGVSGTLTRQFVTAVNATTPGSVTRTNSAGSVITIDDASTNLANFDGVSIPVIANGGYGTQVGFNASGARSSVSMGRRVYVAGRFDHSVKGNLSVTEAAAGSAARTVNGNMVVYHNLLKVVGTSTFNNVSHSDTCCVPVSGSITTAFTAGTNVAPTLIGSKIVGKSETLTFTGCGTGTLQSPDGTSSDVSLSNCF